MECRLAGLLFTSKFDSGNLARVERVGQDDEDDGTGHRVGDANAAPDYEFNLWTNPDCGGTEFENGNRTWFHFAVKGCPMNKLIKFNIMNMNKQGKLYSQGLAPVVKVLPQKPKWERIRDRPSHETVDGQFILSFTYRFEYRFSTVYFAFCYPFSYTEYQDKLTELDNKFSSRNYDSGCPNSAIYYHREILCHSLDKLRVDLVTISSCHGLTTEREPRLHKLFPDTSTERARKFKGKRVYFLSSRVHPGETPASFVFNGFLDFILRTKDERAIQLRKQYVFKLIPLLNPDGVQRGYYRTDQRGVNLNRVYLNPDPELHPSIFAAKSVVLHHHVNSRVLRSAGDSGPCRGIPQESGENPTGETIGNERTEDLDKVDDTEVRAELGKDKFVIEKKGTGANAILVVHRGSKNGSSPPLSGNEEKRPSPNDEERNSCGDRLAPVNDITFLPDGTSHNSNAISRDDASVDDSDVESDIGMRTQPTFCNQFNNNAQTVLPVSCGDTDPMSIPSEESGVAFYVDLHGHASKRGCFIYGNFHEDEERQTENLLYPKLIAMNSAHFDFDGCNFTEKNMYTKDRRDGMSKEGSGRVGIYKATGIIHSYTLECNYNSGRFVNSLAPASNDDGRATPPPLAGYPPKYGPQHYEEVGRATAIAALDITDTNPWSRLAGTENGSVHGVRAWVQRYLRSMRGAPSLPKKMSRMASKTSSLVATVMTPAKPSNRTNLFQSGNSSNNTGNSNTTGHSSLQQNASNSPKRTIHSKPLGPVRETRASMERRKHLATLQGTGISTSTASSGAPTSTTATMGAASALTSGGKNFTIPLPLTHHHKQSPPSTTRSLKPGSQWAHKKNKSDSMLGKNTTSESGGQKEFGNQLSPRTLLSKSTNNLGVFNRHGGPLASSTLPSVVTELLNSVMINALDGSKDLSKEESQPFSSASIAQQRTAMYVKNHGAPSALSPKAHQPNMFPRQHMTMDLGISSSSSKPVQHHGNVHVEGEKSDLKALGSLCLHEESHEDSADKTKKRRKKVNGPKRRSISHSPSRKSQKNSHRMLSKGGKHSETDSDPERLMNRRTERTRQRSLTSSLSDPTPNDVNPMSERTAAYTSNLDPHRAITPKSFQTMSQGLLTLSQPHPAGVGRLGAFKNLPTLNPK